MTRKRKPIYVYFIKVGSFVKIGQTTDVERRLEAIGQGLPTMKVVGLISATPGTELEMHRRFAAHRVKGEWFRWHPDIRAFVKDEAGENWYEYRMQKRRYAMWERNKDWK